MSRFMGAIFPKINFNQFMTKLNYSYLPYIKENKDGSVFLAPWQGQLFAITVHMSDVGYFTWNEFTTIFAKYLKLGASSKISEINLDNKYYNCWLNALEELIINKKFGDKKTLQIFKKKWKSAFNNTPHGQPVKIENL
ncbi:MAG: nitrile hydratase accessory protein [Paracoccaceae bacterium]